MAFGLALDPGSGGAVPPGGQSHPRACLYITDPGHVGKPPVGVGWHLGRAGVALWSCAGGGSSWVCYSPGHCSSCCNKLGWVKGAQLALALKSRNRSFAWRKGLLAFGVTVLVAGLLFLRVPQGLGALAQTIPDYLNGWLKPGEVPALRLPAALLVYQPLALLFGLVAAVRGWMAARSGLRSAYLALLLSLWALVALLLAFIYPARQVADLGWTLIPLWALAAMEISRHLPAREDLPTRLVALGLSGLVLLLMVISWVNLLTLVRMNGNPLLYGAVIAGALFMAVIAALLVAMGWSYPAARLGLIGALLFGLEPWHALCYPGAFPNPSEQRA